jgi:hypothetical protein
MSNVATCMLNLISVTAGNAGMSWSRAAWPGARFSIWEPANPWEAMRNLVADVLNDAQHDSEPARFDMNVKLGKPSAAPPPRPPETD